MTLLWLSVRNLRRDPLRTTLTILAGTAAIAGFVLLRSVVTSWQRGADYAARDRISTRNKTSFMVSLPRHYVDTIRATEGVEHVTFLTLFQGRDTRHPEQFFANFATDGASFLSVYDEVVVTPEQKRAWLDDRQGALVGSTLARQLGLRRGDKITLRGTLFPGEWEFRVAAIYTTSRRSFNDSSFVFHWDYLNERVAPTQRDRVGMANARVHTAEAAPAVSERIDKRFEASGEPTDTISERAASLSSMGLFSAVLHALDWIGIAILAIVGLILANTLTMSVRERTAEYAVMRVLGFAPRHIKLIVIAEATAIALLAGLLGICIAWTLTTAWLARVVEETMAGLFPVFHVEATTALLALLSALLLGAAGAWPSSRRVAGLPIAAALRRVE